ncbi:MAG: hypothetical protein J6D29_06395 [Solobacterium sp.]|nr:hypothetical protein [Solobacterium sp.]
MNMNFSMNWNVNLAGILTIIGFWGIFSRFQEAGWKAIVPIYREYVWSKILKREDLGKKYVWTSVAAIIVGIIITILAVIIMAMGKVEQTGPNSFELRDFSAVPRWMVLVLGLVTFVLLALGIYVLVLQYQLGKAHVEMDHGASWLKWCWLIIPSITAIYFGFIHTRYHIDALWDKNYQPNPNPTPDNPQ